MLYKTRILLIRLGKITPFLICFLVLISYCECLYALITNDFVATDDAIVLNKPVSWAIGEYFRYNVPTLFLLAVLSIAIRTCIWNKLSLLYLAIQLWEKDYFITTELYVEQIYIVVVVNISICAFFVYKGIRIVTQS